MITVRKFITTGKEFEFEPSFSANGNELVYVTWDDEALGTITKLNIKTKGAKPVKLTTEKGIYRMPSFSPDGSKVVYVKEGGNDHQGFTFTTNTGIYLISSNGGEAKLVT